jgi:hypothetical protein
MAASLIHERDNIYRVDISGVLRKSEFTEVQRPLAAAIERGGRLRLFIVLTGFDGWEAGANWQDLSFYVRYGDAIDRIAIVGDERWRSEALMFAGADLRRGQVAFFPDTAGPDARSWLAA